MGKSHGMFDLPDAKRARVEGSDESDEEGLSSHASWDGQEEDHDDAIRARLRAQVERVLSVDDGAPPAQQPGEDAEPDDHPLEEAFEFRLFASSAKGGAAPPQKVVLVHDDLDAAAGEGGFVVPSRPLHYYLPGDPTPQETEMFRAAAVSGEDVLQRSAQRCWGLEVPWRVTKVTVTRKEMRALLANDPREDVVALPDGSDENETAAAEVQKKKRRPGKKRRIALRTKDRALQAAEKRRREKLDAEERLKVSKEEHLREKNKRLNREKKLKRRQKERDKKQASKAAFGEAGTTVERAT